MTGWAQVNGLRGDTSITDRIVHDLHYIRNWSPVLDARIMLMTAFGGMVNPDTQAPARTGLGRRTAIGGD